ncbi:restriction endonuclease subunit S [Streptomyces buecherae]|uniref:restriction endonuclease subunit S n=1 Tax=Streptomyces buecherae TaxID=2763006 RepID=UPI003662A16F
MALTVTPADLVAAAERSDRPGLLGRHSTWERVRLGEIASVLNGFAFKSDYFNHDGSGTPLIRIRDVSRGSTETHYSGEYESQYLVNSGEIIVGMDGDFRVSVWRGTGALLNQRVCKISIRDDSLYSPAFLVYTLQGYLDAIAQATSSVTVKHLSSRSLQEIPLPLPPLAEQHRIVEALEDHISRLDTAVNLIASCAARAKGLLPRVMQKEINRPGTPVFRLDEIAEVRLGRQRSPKNHNGTQMRPYLRAANVGWQGLLLDDVKKMNFTDKEAETYRLRTGDIVLSEASGSPGEVGKPAIWGNEIKDCCFQNTLIRVRPNKGIEPKFLLYFLRSEALNGSFRKGARGVGIHHLGAAKLSAWQVPLPTRREQIRVVEALEGTVSRLENARTLLHGAKSAAEKATTLRKALFARAFTGRLVPQDPTDEPASVLLDRIRAEREAQSGSKAGKARRAPRRPRKAAAADAPPPPPPAATSDPATTAVQQELPL